MARTSGPALGHPAGAFRHGKTGVVISYDKAGMRHSAGPASHEVPFYIGSGRVGRSYLVRIAGALFQSPASWYASLKEWRISPGYEADDRPEFDRPVTPECLFCHTTGVRHVPVSINRYRDPPFTGGIGCVRCHGEGEEHVRRPRRANIVNPARLPARARDSICEACHLSGEARILNEGFEFDDFRPGMNLEQVLSVFVADRPEFRVVSHSEQLAASPCAKDTRLWCGSCHDPHRDIVDSVAWYRSKCLSCHTDAHHQPAGNCTACHMTKRAARDVAHTAYTDHRISRRPHQTAPSRVPASLRTWRGFAGGNRELGLAYIAAGEKHQSASLLQEGFRILTTSGNSFNDDAPVLTAVGQVLMRKQRPKEAARLFARAVDLQPRDPRHHLNLAAALSAVPDLSGALAAAERAISIEPTFKPAYVLAAEICRRKGERGRAEALMRNYRRFE